MLGVIFISLSIITALIYLSIKRDWSCPKVIETFLATTLFFNVGILGLLGFYVHTFYAADTARSIGWASGSPFQFEVAVANLAFGVVGILSWFFRGYFWLALVLAYVIYFVGCFYGHIIQYRLGDTAPYNIGIYIWLVDLIVPIIALVLLCVYFKDKKCDKHN